MLPQGCLAGSREINVETGREETIVCKESAVAGIEVIDTTGAGDAFSSGWGSDHTDHR